MKKRSLLLLTLFFSNLLNAQSFWIQKNDFPGNSRTRGICFTLNNYGYYGTGNHTSGQVESSDFWQYDAVNDSWQQKASLPNGMQAASSSASVNFGYVGNGWWSGNGHIQFYKYDDISNSWTSIANYIGNVTNDGVAIVLNNILYAGLGAQPYSSNCWDDWKVYDEGNNTWASLSPFPGIDRRNAVSFTLQNDIYVGGGQPEGGSQGNDFYKYIPSTDTWQAIASCPSNSITSSRNSSFTLNGKAYLALNDGLWEYDPVSNAWQSYAMPFNGSVDAAFTLNNKGYIIKAGTQEVWEWTYCSQSSGTDEVTSCGSYTWIDGNTYTSSNNSATHILTNAAGCDSVVTLDLTINEPNSGTDVITACDNYTWIDGVTYTSSTNTPTYTLANSVGCDSTVTLDLTINSSPSSQVTQNGGLLTADQPQASYQWLDCDNNFSIIPGGINQFFLPEESGNYAVEVSMNGCTDTSSCLLVDYTGLNANYNADIINIYPNPTADILFISGIDNLSGIKTIEITSMSGKKVMVFNSVQKEINVTSLASGIYLLNILHESGKGTIRFIKE